MPKAGIHNYDEVEVRRAIDRLPRRYLLEAVFMEALLLRVKALSRGTTQSMILDEDFERAYRNIRNRQEEETNA